MIESTADLTLHRNDDGRVDRYASGRVDRYRPDAGCRINSAQIPDILKYRVYTVFSDKDGSFVRRLQVPRYGQCDRRLCDRGEHSDRVATQAAQRAGTNTQQAHRHCGAL